MARAPSFPMIVSLLVLATALAGCHGFDEDDGNGGPTTTPPGTTTTPPTSDPTTTPPGTSTPPVEPLDITLNSTDVPTTAEPGDVITFNVTVTGDSGSTTHAGAHYSFTSTAGLTEESLEPADFEGPTPHVTSFTFPGMYTVENWTLPDSDNIYVRPHILAGGDHHWGPEYVINITGGTPPPPPPDVEEGAFIPDEIIQIGTLVTGSNANYEDDTPTTTSTIITVGQSIQWVNRDSAQHTATHGATPPLWNTGALVDNEESAVFRFNVAGTYAYICAIHPPTQTNPGMSGTIRVDA